jgi:hypothetical protein
VRGRAVRSLFTVFGNPEPGRAEELAHWYDAVHGPDALANGSFIALHRYRAVTPSQAQHLAVWEGDHASMAEAAAYIKPRAAELRAAGRVTDAQVVVHAQMWFLCEAAWADTPAGVVTMTTVFSDLRRSTPPLRLDVEAWHATAGYRYSGDDAWPHGRGTHLVLLEHAARPVASPEAAQFSFPPRPGYRGLFDMPPPGGADAAPGEHTEDDPQGAGPWAVRWEPVASLSA